MLSIPLKTCTHVEIKGPIYNYIAAKYKKRDAKTHWKPIEAIQDLRMDMRLRLDRGDISEATKDLLIKYYGQLVVLDSRFPIHEKELKLEFTWTDSFKPKQKTALKNVIIEKVAILFNIGAIYSYLATNESMNTDEGLKKACNYFQIAAGCFHQAKEIVTVHPMTVPTNDISLDGLQFCFTLMMAQAQDCLVEKVIKDKKVKEALTAKLCAQATDFYQRAYGLSHCEQLTKHLDKSWHGYCKMKMLYYKAVMHHRLSIPEGAKKAYGMEVTHLAISAENLKEAKKICSKLVTPFPNVDRLYSVVQKKYEGCKSDNDQIYHESVLNESELKPIEKKTTIKPIDFPDPTALPDFVDNFQSLIPVEVHGSIKKYVERRDAVVLGGTNKASEADANVIAVLESLNLPESIMSFTSGGSLPDNVRAKVDAVRNDGGVAHLMDLVKTIGELSSVDRQELDKAQMVLKQEEAEDNELRKKWGSRWRRQPSHVSNGQLMNEISVFKSKVEQAGKSDNVLRSDAEKVQSSLALFDNEQELLKPLAAANTDSSGATDALVGEIQGIMDELRKNDEERKGFVSALRDVAQTDEITDKIVQTNLTEHEMLFKEELKKYDGYVVSIDKNIAAHIRLIEKLKQKNGQFVSSRPGTKSQTEAYLEQLINAANGFEKLKGELGQGVHFYSKLQEHLHRLGQKCNDFVFARQTEKQQLLQALTGVSGGGVPLQQVPQQQQQYPQTGQYQQPGGQQGVQPGQFQQPGMQPGMQQPGQYQPGMQQGQFQQHPGQVQQPGMYIQPGMQNPNMQFYQQQYNPGQQNNQKRL